MSDLSDCQLPGVPKLATGTAKLMGKSTIMRMKSMLAVPWNYHVKKWIKRAYHTSLRWRGASPVGETVRDFGRGNPFKNGDLVRVRSHEEINSTLDPFKELKGCAFLPNMYQYCGSQQRVLKEMQYFLDERDYKLKKVHGVILLENVICSGTPAFGPCDRCCFLFWREEWLERLAEG